MTLALRITCCVVLVVALRVHWAILFTPAFFLGIANTVAAIAVAIIGARFFFARIAEAVAAIAHTAAIFGARFFFARIADAVAARARSRRPDAARLTVAR